jgi:pyruvate/2-oxoglutarate dehydrogenase complex dihydrolipoamide dehydrogenase (E3) component
LLPVLPSNLTLLTNQVYYDIKQLPDDDKLTVTLEDESIIRADACVLALNPRPNSKLAKQAVDLDFDGSVLVNGYMQTSDPFIYAIGDLVKIPFMNGNERIYLPLIVNAKRESYIAAINILHGNHKEYPTSQRTIGTELFGHYFGSTGITESEAPFYNKKIQSITNTYDSLSNYGALAEQYLRLKVIFEAGSKQILGVQLATNARQLLELVNLFAVMIEHRDTIEDLLNIDYYFAPKLSPLINLMGDIITKVYALENQAEK